MYGVVVDCVCVLKGGYLCVDLFEILVLYGV